MRVDGTWWDQEVCGELVRFVLFNAALAWLRSAVKHKVA